MWSFLQGAVAMCDWMVQHGSDPKLLNISNAVFLSPTENDIYQTMPFLEACSPTPGVAPTGSAGPQSKAAGRVSSFMQPTIPKALACNAYT